MQNSTKFCH